MKKLKKVLASAVFVVLGMVLATGSLYAAGYINWKGTQNFQNASKNLTTLEQHIGSSKEEITELRSKQAEHEEDIKYYETYNEQLLSTVREYEKSVADRDNSILELQTMIEQRDATIKELQDMVLNAEEGYEQAYQDMVTLDNRIQNIINELE